MKVRFATPVPLFWQAPDGDATKVVKADLYDLSNVHVGTQVTLTHVAAGFYRAAGPAMPGTLYAFAVIQAFASGGITPYTNAVVTYDLDVTTNLDSLTGFLDDHVNLPVRDTLTLVRNEDATIPFTLIKARDTFVPLDISAATEIVARFVKEDGTKLEKTMTSGAVVIVNGPAGQGTVSVAQADTKILQVSERANMEIQVQFGAAPYRIVQIRGKLNVRDSILC